MGQQRVLVVMANKDVYYMTTKDAADLVHLTNSATEDRSFEFFDAKTGALTTIFFGQVSSLVDEAHRG
jgi:hypothetical protein